MAINSIEDCKLLQHDLNRVVEWSNINKLHFNVNKCNLMTCTRAMSPQHFEYKVQSEPIRRVASVRDLGLTITKDLSFSQHITEICKRAFRNLGFVLRNYKDIHNISAVKCLYNVLVRSRLESKKITHWRLEDIWH